MTSPRFAVDLSSVSIAGAEAAVAAARAEADRRGVAVTIAVLDRGGHLQLLARMDGIHAGTVAVAIAKAKTAVLYNKPTAQFAAALAAGNLALLSLPDLIAYAGGLPLLVDGRPAGAIGVSGAAPDVDNAIAEAGEAGFRQGIGGA